MGERSRNYVAVKDRLPEDLAPYMVSDSPELKLNLFLPTIYSQNTSMSLTQTDASIDYDRKLFLSKRGSAYRESS